MNEPSISRKPSQTHFLWESGAGGETKRFDADYFRKWCRHLGYDFETYTRVDHDRGDDPRTQYQCVFSTQTGAGDSFEMGGEEWDIQTEEVPQTFVEIDEEGLMRVSGWSTAETLDVTELWHDGTDLLVRAAGRDKPLRLNTEDLTA